MNLIDLFKADYPEPEKIDISYEPFGERLKAIRKEKGMSQDEFAALLGTSKQVLSRYETSQRVPRITQVQLYAQKLNVSADYLMGDAAEEAAFNTLCNMAGDHPPFYKIFCDVTWEMGLDIPGIVRVTGLSDKQVRTIIMRRMKDAPLPIALMLSDTLGVPLEVWTGDAKYTPRDISVEGREVAKAYDQANTKDKNFVRYALGLEPIREEAN